MTKKKYKVLVRVTSDKTRKEFLPGDELTGAEFPKKVIENWLEIGVLDKLEEDVLDEPEPLEIPDGEEVEDG